MKVVDVYKLAIRVLKKQAKECPSKSFTNSSGETVTIKDIADKMETVVKWIHPELYTDDVACVVRCKKCRFYKTYKKKGAFKSVPFKACCKDMKKRDPMFFCAEGERLE